MTTRSLGKRGLVALTGLTMAVVGTVGYSSSAVAAAKPKVLIVDNVFDLKTVDPGRMFELTGNLIDRALYSTLMTFKGSDASTPVPDLALSYTASADAKTFTYTLRKNAVFSDGTKVTSADVVFSLMRVKNLKGNASSYMDGITVTASGPYTVIVKSDVPNTAIPVIMCSPPLGIVNSKVVKREGGLSDATASTNDKAEIFLNTTSAGSGPYILTKFSLTTEVDLAANPKYWGAQKPGYSKVVIRNVPPNIQRLDVLKGATNIAADLAPKQTVGMKGVNVLRGLGAIVWFMYSNANPKVSPISSDVNFQEAIRYGLDYKALVTLAGPGTIQTAGIIPNVFLGALKPSDAIVQDVTRAKAALAKSVYKGEEMGLRYWAGGGRDGIIFDDLATRVASQLKTIGINIKLLPTPIGPALVTYRDGSDALGLWLWGPDWPDSSNYLKFGPGNQVGLRMGWPAGSDPAIEALMTKAVGEVDPVKRAADYRQFQLDLNKQSPLIPLLQSPSVLVSTKSVKGLKSHPIWLINLNEIS